jgi:hypothetical protein
MVKHRIVAAACLMLALAAGVVVAEEKTALKSGPQVGAQVPGPFHPLNINGANAGEKFCLYCKNGQNPVAMVFARDASEPLTKLIKQLDHATAKNAGCSMGSFVVFLSDSDSLEKQLKEVAEKEKLKHTILSIDNPSGPKGYEVAKDADVTVVLYTEHKVKANYAFKKGELSGKAIDQIVADIAKITPEK